MSIDVLNHKIIQALERISKAFRVLLWEESKKYGISPIQIQILIFCLTHKQEMLKVSFLAKEFDLTKATVSDSVKVLLKKELIQKIPDTYDSRSYAIALTPKGRDIAKNINHFTKDLDTAVNSIGDVHKGGFLKSLLDIIHSLNKNEVISTQRMCLTCCHYDNKNGEHFCHFLNSKLHNNELQIDCPDHKIPA